MVAKRYIHTPKPQIQSVEPRKRRLGMRTMPCVFLVKREELRSFDVFFFFGCFFVCFLCLKEGKTCGKIPSKEQKLRKKSFQV